MGNDEIFSVGVAVGFILSATICLLIAVKVDSGYKQASANLERINKLCTLIQSEPKSFDQYEATCANGVVISYRSNGE